MSFAVPVLLIAFNRPDSTARVLEVLRELKPEKLYLACDGPRADRPVDAERCAAVRSLMAVAPAGLVDWPCRLHTLYRDTNLGCRSGVSSALDWFFQHEEEGIVLEDDILPDSSFFPYCAQLLQHFRHDMRIGSIAANNHQRMPPADGSSYYFSNYSHCWGWATWRRAWRYYDRDMNGWPAFDSGDWLEQLGGKAFARRWRGWLEELAIGRIDTWDMIWQLSCWQQGFLTVIPEVELVENIGFGREATHTLDEQSPLGPRGSIRFPLRHPSVIQPDRKRDLNTFKRIHVRSPLNELKRKALKGMRILGLR